MKKTPATAKTDGGPDAVTDTLDVLSHRRRRYVLYYLHDRSGPVDADELARQILAWETDTSVGNLTDEEREKVVMDLYHTHLPKLADRGMIKYDDRTLTARSWDHAELLTPILKFVKQIEGKTNV